MPLGFSDLVDDEAFVISVFRCRKAQNGARNIETGLRNEKLGDKILCLFEILKKKLCVDKQTDANDSLIVAALEEYLLTEVGSKLNTASQSVEMCRKNLELSGMTIRPAANIPRPGHDYLVEIIGRKTMKVFEALSRSQLKVWILLACFGLVVGSRYALGHAQSFEATQLAVK